VSRAKRRARAYWGWRSEQAQKAYVAAESARRWEARLLRRMRELGPVVRPEPRYVWESWQLYWRWMWRRVFVRSFAP